MEPLTRDRAKKELNRCLERKEVYFSRHFREELANDNLANSDVISLPVRREGTALDGRRMAVVFRFDQAVRAVFITVFVR